MKVDEFIKKVMEKTDDVFIPEGKIEKRLPTGIQSLDKILGGGIPEGTITQIYGLEGVGKSTASYHIIGSAIKNGYETCLIALERYSEDYAAACGVDIRSPLYRVVSASFAEHTFNTIIYMIRETPIKVIVVDSIVAVPPKSVLEKKQPTQDMDKGPTIGAMSRVISDFIKKVQLSIRRNGIILILVNQFTTNIGGYHSSLSPDGGLSLQYNTDIKIKMHGKEVDRNNSDKTTVSLTLDKSKLWGTTSRGSTKIDIYHGKGIDLYADLMNICESGGVISKKGAWYSYGDIKWQGTKGFRELLEKDEKLANEIKEKAKTAEVKWLNEEEGEEGFKEETEGK